MKLIAECSSKTWTSSGLSYIIMIFIIKHVGLQLSQTQFTIC